VCGISVKMTELDRKAPRAKKAPSTGVEGISPDEDDGRSDAATTLVGLGLAGLSVREFAIPNAAAAIAARLEVGNLGLGQPTSRNVGRRFLWGARVCLGRQSLSWG